jgi:hypothetical protein
MDWLDDTTADTVLSYVLIMATAGAVLVAAALRLDSWGDS